MRLSLPHALRRRTPKSDNTRGDDRPWRRQNRRGTNRGRNNCDNGRNGFSEARSHEGCQLSNEFNPEQGEQPTSREKQSSQNQLVDEEPADTQENGSPPRHDGDGIEGDEVHGDVEQARTDAVVESESRLDTEGTSPADLAADGNSGRKRKAGWAGSRRKSAKISDRTSQARDEQNSDGDPPVAARRKGIKTRSRGGKPTPAKSRRSRRK